MISRQYCGEISLSLLIGIHCVDEKSVDPEQLASGEASCSESTLFSKEDMRVWKKPIPPVHLLGQI